MIRIPLRNDRTRLTNAVITWTTIYGMKEVRNGKTHCKQICQIRQLYGFGG